MERAEGIVSGKPRPKSAHDFLGLLYCFIVLLCICVASCPYMIYYPTVMARYSLFVLKVPLNTKQTNIGDSRNAIRPKLLPCASQSPVLILEARPRPSTSSQ